MAVSTTSSRGEGSTGCTKVQTYSTFSHIQYLLLTRVHLLDNLPIELKSSLTIGSANRQSTLHVEAWVDLEMMVSQGKTGLHVEPASTWKSQQTSRENKQKATRGVGFGPDIYNKRSPLTRSQNRLQNPGFAAGRESPAGWSQPGSPN